MRIDHKVVKDIYLGNQKVVAMYLGTNKIYGKTTVTFKLTPDKDSLATVETGYNGLLPQYPDITVPDKPGYGFAGWAMYENAEDWDPVTDSYTPINLSTQFVTPTTVYPYYYSTIPDAPELIKYFGFVDDGAYVYYRPTDHEEFMREYFNFDDFQTLFNRVRPGFYIELFAFSKENGDFNVPGDFERGEDRGRYYFADVRENYLELRDPYGEDLDGDGISDTLLGPLRPGYHHSTDIVSSTFTGGIWLDFIAAVMLESSDYWPSFIVDCLDQDVVDRPYILQVINVDNTELVAICTEDYSKQLVVGGRDGSGNFVAVPPTEQVYYGTAYEVLPVEEWISFASSTNYSSKKNTNSENEEEQQS